MAILAAALTVTSVGLQGCSESVHAQEADPSIAIQSIFDAMSTAWAAGDPVAYTTAFTDAVDFINIRGDVFEGKDAVVAAHAKIFAGPFKGSQCPIVIRKIVTLAPGVLLVDTDQTVTNFKGLPPGISATSPGILLTHLKYVAVKQGDGTWKLMSAQNTSVVPA
jgi:uncharacterized protein (TIGR02246 family)